MMISGRLGGRLLSNDPVQQPFTAQTIASCAGDASARAIHKRQLDASSSSKAEGFETTTSAETTNVTKTTFPLTKSLPRSLSAAAATDATSLSFSSSSSSTIRSSSLSSLSVLGSSTTPGTATVPTPVKLLQFIFSRTAAGRQVLLETAAQSSAGRPKTFPKPSPLRTKAFQLNVVQAVRSRDLVQCRALLAQGSSFDACNLFGESLLHMACRKGDVDMVQFLVHEAHVQVNVHDDFGRTPFHDALWTRTPNFATMDVLLESVSPLLLLMQDVRCHTPFHYARREHWKDWVIFLKERSKLIGERLCAIQLNSTSNLGTNDGLMAENSSETNEH